MIIRVFTTWLFLSNVSPIFGDFCKTHLFFGTPKEAHTRQLASYPGYWTAVQCKERCSEHPACKEFRINLSQSNTENGCVLFAEGTTESGEGIFKYEMLRLTRCNYCDDKLFDGRPKEWDTDGYEIQAFDGYWTVEACSTMCYTTRYCKEYRVKKHKDAPHKGCVLMREGTTYSGEFTDDYEMYKLVTCSVCGEKLFDGRPNEWNESDGKVIAHFAGWHTHLQCITKCVDQKGCEEYRILKDSQEFANSPYDGCVLMKGGTTESGEFYSYFETYKMLRGEEKCGYKNEKFQMKIEKPEPKIKDLKDEL